MTGLPHKGYKYYNNFDKTKQILKPSYRITIDNNTDTQKIKIKKKQAPGKISEYLHITCVTFE